MEPRQLLAAVELIGARGREGRASRSSFPCLDVGVWRSPFSPSVGPPAETATPLRSALGCSSSSLSSPMDPPPHRPSRGAREPAAQVKRLESQAVLPGTKSPSVTPGSRPHTRSVNDAPSTQEEYSSDGSTQRSSFTKGSTTSFEAMRATVAEDRRREHRTPSTAPNPTASTLRKAQYLKSNKSRLAVATPTRACTPLSFLVLATPSSIVGPLTSSFLLLSRD